MLLAAPVSNALALNPIQIENAQPGTTAWRLPGATPTSIPDASTAIEGYGSQISLAPGDTLALHVSTTPAAQYRVEIYRLGWYGGAGGRRIACLPSCTGGEAGVQQATAAADPNTGELDAGWPVTDTVAVTSSWVSGYYLAKFVLVSGPARGQASEFPFIVRAPAGTTNAILVQASVNTWEAYNNWGGKSLYAYQSSGPTVPASQTTAAAMVSFSRPFAPDWNTTPLTWEYGLVRYLEQRGYDVTYTTDVDTDLNPGSLLGHRLDIVNGHDEYWSPTMRNAWEAARAAGVNEAFVGGDIGYWQARYSGSDRTLVEYRQANLDPEPDPQLKTTEFYNLNPPRPECTLLGISSQGGLAKAGDPPRSYSVPAAALSNAWFSGTGFTAGATIQDSVGYEWDAIKPGCSPSGTQVLLSWSGSPSNADAVTYTASSGARVFSDGSMQLVWALSDYGHPPHADARVQALFTNIFNDLGAPPPPNTAPAPVLLSPIAGAWEHSPVTFAFDPRTSSPETFTLAVDGKTAVTLQSSSCAPASCSVTARVPKAGRHTWQVIASADGSGQTASKLGRFGVDNTPPTAAKLTAPVAGAVVWNPRPTVRWKRSHDTGSGVAGYRIRIDGKAVGFTTHTSFTLPKGLSDARHTVRIISIDKAGNQRASTARAFRVSSVRLARRTRAQVLSRGFVLLAYCARGCRVHVVLRTAHGTLLAAGTRGYRRGGIEQIALALAPGARTVLGSSHGVRLVFQVVTTVGRAKRTVMFTARF